MRLLCALALFRAPPSTGQQEQTVGVADDGQPLTCRITTQHTLYEIAGRVEGREEIVCVPYHHPDDSQRRGEDGLYTVTVPGWLLSQIETTTSDDGHDLFVNVTAASLDHDKEQVVLNVNSQFIVVPEPETSRSRRRRLQRKRYEDALGIRTYAIVLISTADSASALTVDRLRARFTDSRVGMEAQYRACSADRLAWRLRGVHHVTLTERLADFGNSPSPIRNAATRRFLEENGLHSMEDLADNILYCLPPGTGGWGEFHASSTEEK